MEFYLFIVGQRSVARQFLHCGEIWVALGKPLRRRGQIVIKFGLLWRQANSRLDGALPLLDPARCFQRHAETVERFGMVGPDF